MGLRLSFLDLKSWALGQGMGFGVLEFRAWARRPGILTNLVYIPSMYSQKVPRVLLKSRGVEIEAPI